MDDKVFNLLEKMYADLSGKIDNVNQEVQGLKNQVSKLEFVIENEIKPDIKASLEGYSQVYRKLEEHDKKLDSIESKIEAHDVEINVIKRIK